MYTSKEHAILCGKYLYQADVSMDKLICFMSYYDKEALGKFYRVTDSVQLTKLESKPEKSEKIT